MSTTIDQRVVEMRFDNRHFENNVKTTMSTLDRLKQSLNLHGASKGLESVNSAAKKVDMNNLGSAVETVSAKFSALQVMGVTALANITNSAVNAGKRMVSALTIDPIKTGFQEYETQINAVQTILANTSSKGSDINDVNKALDELNTYADKTIYNFTEMTRNIGTFTAAGVDLDTSVSAIQGIANLAAVSGSTSQQASTAMYQLSQALASGTVKLQDWNSVVNAGMGGEVFQNALKRTATVMGTNVDALIEKYGSFRESLTQGEWLTTDVLTETLNQFTMAAEEGSKEWNEFKESLKEKGYTEEQAVEILKMANTATDAATKVKTFTQLWDVLKESAQSGWSQTWKLLIGDFEEAKSVLTPLADVMTGFINKMSDARNKLLETALAKSFTGLADKIQGIVDPVKKSADSVKTVVDAVKDYGAVVDEIIGGKWGNGQERWDSLTKAGYDWAHAQNLVNEKLGDGTRHATDYSEAQDKVSKKQEASAEAQGEISDATAKQIALLAEKSETELRSLGYTDEQIKAFKELAEAADKTGIPIQDFIKNIDEIDGRYLLLNSFKNVGQSLITVFKSIGEAWRDAFPPMSADQLFNIIAGIHKFSTYLIVGEDTAKNLTRTLKGLFAILDIVTTIVGGGFKLAFKAISALLEHFDTNILEVTAVVGDMLVGFRDAFEATLDFGKVFDYVIPLITEAIEAIREWISAFMELPIVQSAINGIKDSLSGLVEVGRNAIEGLAEGLRDGVTSIPGILMEIGRAMITAICSVLGIHSPSREMHEVGTNVIDGLVNGIQNGISKVIEAIGKVADYIKDLLSNIDWNTVFAGGISVGMLLLLKKLVGAFEMLAAPLEGLGDMFEGAGKVLDKAAGGIKKVLKSFANVMNSIAFSIKAKALRNIAVSIAILVGAIALLTFLDIGKLWNAVGVVAALSAILVVLAIATNKMSETSVDLQNGSAKMSGLKTGLLAIAASLLLLGITVKLIGSMDIEQAKQGFIGLAGLVVAIAGVFLAYGTLVKGKSAKNIDKAGTMMFRLSVSLLILAGVIKIVGGLEEDELKTGIKVMAAFTLFVAAMIKVTKESGKNVSKFGSMLLKMSIALGLLVGVMKLIGMLSPGEMFKGAIFMTGFVLFVKALVKATSYKVGNDQQAGIYKIGGLMLAISAALLLMTATIKLLSGMSIGDITKGAVAIAAFTGIIVGLLYVVKTFEHDAPKLAGTIVAMSIAIGIMAGVAIMLSLISIEGLAKGIAAVGMLGAIMALMIYVTKDAKQCHKNLIVMTVAIAIMATAVAALSMIDGSKLAGATAAMSILMGMFALIVKSANKRMNKSLAALIVMTVAIGLLAGIIYALSKLPVQSVLGTAASMSILMLSMAAIMKVMSATGRDTRGALTGILTLTAMVIPLSIFAFAITKLPDVSGAKNNVITLTALLGAMTLLLIPLTLIGSLGKGAPFLGVLALTTMVAPLAAFAFAISTFPDISKAEATIVLLTKLMTAMTLLLLPLTLVGYLAIGAGLGVVALTAMVIPLSVFALALNKLPDITYASANIALLTGLMETLTNLLVKISPLAPLAVIGVVAITALGGVVTAFGILATAIGALMEKFPSLQSFLDIGIAVLEGIADGLGRVIGSFISGFAGEVMTILPELGTALSSFMTNAQPFIDGIKMVDESVLTGIGILTKAILALTAADLISGVSSFLQGGSSFASLGTELSNFMTNAQPFMDSVKNADPTIMEGVKNLADALLTLTKADLLQGLISAFGGEVSFENFGTQLEAFGNSIVSFSKAVSAEGGINEEAISAAANAGKIMTELQSAIAPMGGLLQAFSGEKDLGTFGIQLAAYGAAIAAFSKSVSAEGAINEEAITAAKNAGMLMTELQSTIEPTNGVLQWLAGTTSLETFGTQLTAYGDAVSAFSKSVSGENAIDENAITAAANAGKVMAEVQKGIPEDRWLDGKMSIDDFGGKIKKFGESIKKYSDEVADIDTAKVSSSMSAAKSLVQVAAQASELEVDNIGNFNKVKDIGSALKTYYDKVSEIDSSGVMSSVNTAKRLVVLINNMAGIDTSGVSSFKSAISSLASTNISGLVNAFSGATSTITNIAGNIVSSFVNGIAANTSSVTAAGSMLMMSFNNAIVANSSVGVASVNAMMSGICAAITTRSATFMIAGSTLMNGFILGIKIKNASVKTAFTTSLSAASTAIRGYYWSFYYAGSYLVTGFCQGISTNTFRAAAQATVMANAAKQAAKNALDINSPSKVFREIGKSVPEGFAQGIDRLRGVVVNSSEDMASAAIDSVGTTISRLGQMVSNDIDTQPTIRPVLDLSDVRSGAGTINGLFSNGIALATSANAMIVGATMGNHQNGGNADVISAINDLKDTLSRTSGDTYSINGITYDDGSNITDAVKSLVRAAKIERRV